MGGLVFEGDAMASVMQTDVQQELTAFLSGVHPGARVVRVSPQQGLARMADEVARGLARKPIKSLPCTYFYDQRGSELYEEITQQAEYYPTRCETDLLRALQGDLAAMWVEGNGLAPHLVELGSGSSTKTRLLLDAWDADRQPMTYIPVDVSATMLSETAENLVQSYRQLRVLGLIGEYEDALALLPPQDQRLYAFLGGSVGNFSPVYQRYFFRRLAQLAGPGARLLLGFDRAPHSEKPVEVIEQAYNDRLGVTAEFNLNLLAHINTSLGADFDLSAWRHKAAYNPEAQQIEMFLESQGAQQVKLAALSQTVQFNPGERILTEISRKFEPEHLASWFARQGYRPLRCWTDKQKWFGLMLLEITA
jgi:L-histidine N-alpha-methyltransferase